jgi:hypothetical protein
MYCCCASHAYAPSGVAACAWHEAQSPTVPSAKYLLYRAAHVGVVVATLDTAGSGVESGSSAVGEAVLAGGDGALQAFWAAAVE